MANKSIQRIKLANGTIYDIKDPNAVHSLPKYTTINVPNTGWSGSGPWTRTVSIAGGTASSMVDIQPSDDVITTMINSGTTALFIKNDDGTFTLTAMGAVPNATITLQVSITEVTSA